MSTEIVYWGIDNPSRLIHETLDEAVEACLDDCINGCFPDELEVEGYERIGVSQDADGAKNLVIHVLEALDESFGDPDGGPTEPTDAMLEAAREFFKVVLAEYECWACEPTTTVVVDVKEWIAKHRPEWEAKQSTTQQQGESHESPNEQSF